MSIEKILEENYPDWKLLSKKELSKSIKPLPFRHGDRYTTKIFR